MEFNRNKKPMVQNYYFYAFSEQSIWMMIQWQAEEAYSYIPVYMNSLQFASQRENCLCWKCHIDILGQEKTSQL